MLRSSLVTIAAVLVAGCSGAVATPSSGPAPQRGPTPNPAPPPRANPSASVHALGVPPGHLPPPGRCRIWVPGMPPGRQAKARSCHGIVATAQAGSWILYRPSADRTVVRVQEVHTVSAGVVVAVKFFDPSTGAFRREGSPEADSAFGADDVEDSRGRGRGNNDDRGRQRP